MTRHAESLDGDQHAPAPRPASARARASARVTAADANALLEDVWYAAWDEGVSLALAVRYEYGAAAAWAAATDVGVMRMLLGLVGHPAVGAEDDEYPAAILCPDDGCGLRCAECRRKLRRAVPEPPSLADVLAAARGRRP